MDDSVEVLTRYATRLALARENHILTDAEFANYGGSYYAAEIGLWLGQDADGGGIIPYAFQFDNCHAHDDVGDLVLIDRLFTDLGRREDINAYRKVIAEAEANRAAEGYRE